MDAKKLAWTLLKVAASLALLSAVIYPAYKDKRFHDLVAGPKDWAILIWSLPLCLIAVAATIFRWHMLVRTLGIDFKLRDALRAGFLGYLFNLIPFLGLVGGDSLKAVMLIHRQPKRKTEAVASVLVDRIIGLYALLLLAAVASLFLPAEQLERLDPANREIVLRVCNVVQVAALISSLGLIVMLIPAVTSSRLWDRLEHTPLIGGVLHKLVGAMRTYRRRIDRLLIAIVVSVGVHLCYVTAIALMSISVGIAPQHRPSVGSIFIIVPPSMIAGALPIGFYEVTTTLLFRAASPPGAPQNVGLLIALAYRLIQICIASIGVVYWLTSRSEVQELIHEAEELPPEELPLDGPAAASNV